MIMIIMNHSIIITMIKAITKGRDILRGTNKMNNNMIIGLDSTSSRIITSNKDDTRRSTIQIM